MLINRLIRASSVVRNINFNKQIIRSFKKPVQGQSTTPGIKLVAVATAGALAYTAYNYLKPDRDVVKIDNEDTLNLDLNEIYEKTAVMFLKNAELRAALGMPIKVTSHESDEVRQVSLRRENNQLFTFIAYNLLGSINSGVVYCKLRMNEKTHEFNTETIILKLNKPDDKKRKEILIYSKSVDSEANK